MNYENPQIPENINTTKEHPLKDFSILLVSSITLVLGLSALLGFGGGWLAGKIPFSAELKVSKYYDMSERADNDSNTELVEYLQSLVDKIIKAQNLPEDMKITVHYFDDGTKNAFATLGGNLFLYRGLLELMPNENTLVTLIGHEIAHVKYRHPIKSIGSGVAVSIAMSAITGSSDSDVLGDAGMLSVLKFGRDMEQQSDEEAMNNLHTIYGHINGGSTLFEIFKSMRSELDAEETAEIFSTHPMDDNRIENFSIMAEKMGWKETGETTPLPDFYQDAF